jgi:hypothetical protein
LCLRRTTSFLTFKPQRLKPAKFGGSFSQRQKRRAAQKLKIAVFEKSQKNAARATRLGWGTYRLSKIFLRHALP